MIDYRFLQTQAEAEGRRCVVGALILNDAGRVFVHRRSWDRQLLPGCWDIVGGHVEPGETLLEALRREVTEETGWTVSGTPDLAYVGDWETVVDGQPARRREFDFLVEVEGDRDRPRLELPKHVEFRWIGGDGLALLSENRGLDDGMVRRLVELGLRSSRAGELIRPHATIFLDASAVARVEALRRTWDPAMANQIAAHVTIAYSVEAVSIDALMERVGAAARSVASFRLRLEGVDNFGPPEDGVFIDVADVDRGWKQMRELVVGSPGSGLEVEPHVTIVHPRTTNRGPAAWEHLVGTRFDVEVLVEEVGITAFDGRRWLSVVTLPLAG